MDYEAWNFFEDILPPEVAEIVFSFLSLEDIVYVSLVCKPWNNYFDTKDIWKKIIEHYYGELSPKNVDLTQSFRWKRIFITLHNAHSWAKTLSLKGATMTFLSPREPLGHAQMGASGQYIHTLISWIEIKMAGKLVQMKRDPLTIEEKLWIDKGFYTLQTCVMASHNGKYLIRGSDAKCYLVDGEKLASVDVGDYQATRLVVDRYADVFRGVNIEINHQRGHHAYNNNIPSVIFDLQSRCQCVSTFYKDKRTQLRLLEKLQVQ